MILDAEADIEVVGEAVDGADAVRLTRELKSDVVCMDIRMPETDGIAAGLLQKTGTRDRLQAVLWGIRAGVVEVG